MFFPVSKHLELNNIVRSIIIIQSTHTVIICFATNNTSLQETEENGQISFGSV